VSIYKGEPSDDVIPMYVAKTLEKIVSIQFSSYLEQRSLLHPYQHACCCGCSTENILLAAIDFIVQSLDAGRSVCAAFVRLLTH